MTNPALPDRAKAQARAFERLTDGSVELSDDDLAAMSDLDRAGCDRFIASFLPLGPEERFALLERLTQLQETRPLLDYSIVCLAALADEDASVRALAAAGLADNEERESIAPLLGLAINDEDEAVRSEAVVTLGAIALRAEFGQLRTADRAAVVDGLRAIAENSAEETLVRAAALASVAVIDEPWVRDLIFDFFEADDDILRLGAIQAMGRTADAYWIPTLENSLAVMDDDERIAAAVAAGEIADEDALPALAELLEDESIEVLIAVIEAVGEIGGPEAVEQLERVSTHPDSSIRAAVQDALEAAVFADDALGLGA